MDSLTAGFSKLGELVGLSSPKRPVPGEHTQQVRGAMFPPLTGDEGGAAPRRAAPAGSGCCTSPPGRPPSTRLSEASVEGGGTSARLSAALGAASSNEALAPAPAPREASARPPAAAASASGASTSAASSSSNGVEDSRSRKFGLLLAADVVDMKALRSASWSGVPAGRRAMVWQLMLGYLPANREGRTATLERKRREYLDAASMYFDVSDAERCAALSPPLARYACTPARPTTAPRPAPNPRPPAAHPPPRTACRTENQKKNLHQIVIDVPRTAPDVLIVHHPTVQRALERILYVWSERHPASGYVQGINDLAIPFFYAFVAQALPPDRLAERASAKGLVEADVEVLNPAALEDAEADTYWCLSKLIDSIQDHYTFAQPGIQRMVFKLKELVARVDAPLHAHLQECGLQFIQFAFRWMNCLLMRELSLDQIMRVWDTYLAEMIDEGSFGVGDPDEWVGAHLDS